MIIGKGSPHLRRTKQALASLISLCLLWTSGDLAEAALSVPQVLARPQALPQFELVPSPALGRIVDYFNADNQPASQPANRYPS